MSERKGQNLLSSLIVCREIFLSLVGIATCNRILLINRRINFPKGYYQTTGQLHWDCVRLGLDLNRDIIKLWLWTAHYILQFFFSQKLTNIQTKCFSSPGWKVSKCRERRAAIGCRFFFLSLILSVNVIICHLMGSSYVTSCII